MSRYAPDPEIYRIYLEPLPPTHGDSGGTAGGWYIRQDSTHNEYLWDRSPDKNHPHVRWFSQSHCAAVINDMRNRERRTRRPAVHDNQNDTLLIPASPIK